MAPNAQDIVASLIDDIARRVRDALGDTSVLSMFLTGSAAKNEICAAAFHGTLDVYSDVDLWVVIPSAADLHAVRQRVRRAVEGIPLSGEGYRLYARPDVGVFNESDLAAQRARPGTVDIAGAKVVVGDPALPARFARAIGGSIAREEALYLIENRIVELVDVTEAARRQRDAGVHRYASYVALKAGADIGTALLIMIGRFEATRRARAALLRSADVRGRLDFVGSDVLAEADRSADRLENLTTFLEKAGTDSDAVSNIAKALREAWRGIAVRLRGRRGEWNTLIGWRARQHHWRGNSRELHRLSQRVPVSRARMLTKGVTLASLSPVESLRLSGLIESLSRDGDTKALMSGYERFLDDLTATFGFTDGDVFQRARAMFKATT